MQTRVGYIQLERSTNSIRASHVIACSEESDASAIAETIILHCLIKSEIFHFLVELSAISDCLKPRPRIMAIHAELRCAFLSYRRALGSVLLLAASTAHTTCSFSGTWNACWTIICNHNVLIGNYRGVFDSFLASDHIPLWGKGAKLRSRVV